MIYRKTPPQPGRLLLRIVAATGTGTLLGVVACGSPTEHGCMGVCIPVGSTGSADVSSGGTGAGSGSEVMGSTGSASGAGAGTGYEVMGTAGSPNGGTVGSTGYELAGSFTTSMGPAGSGPPQSEAGTPDATSLEAGRIILGLSVAPPDAGSEQ